mmetsp:Transcript_78282/g.221335  ORF Transcript_78282/g.221335 Transcript_78282/m.221335 type:complete len:344 (+) Transcript_78282:311-1342(+)
MHSMRGALWSAGRARSGLPRSTSLWSAQPSYCARSLCRLSRDMLPLRTAVTASSAQWWTACCTMGTVSSWLCSRIVRIVPIVVLCSRHSASTSILRITVKAGSMAFFVWVRSEMPPSPRPFRFVSKKGRAMALATKIAARLAIETGRRQLASASTSKTVIAMAKARQTAEQNAAAPTIAQRAMKAPRSVSVIAWLPVAAMRRKSCSHGGISMAKQWPIRAPMIMVGATTPAGVGSDSAKMVMNHFTAKQATMVERGPRESIDHADWSICSSLSNKVDISTGCVFPSISGRECWRSVFTVTTRAIWRKSRHWQHEQALLGRLDTALIALLVLLGASSPMIASLI